MGIPGDTKKNRRVRKTGTRVSIFSLRHVNFSIQINLISILKNTKEKNLISSLFLCELFLQKKYLII